MIDVSTKQSRAKFYGTSKWKQLRMDILERDNYECLFCKENGDVTTKPMIDGKLIKNDVILEVDHIKELEYYPELALDSDNLRTLCKDCHNKRHKRFNFRESKRKSRWDDEWWG